MKKKDIIDLITAHYEDDPRLFFHKTIEVLKEFKEDGDNELVEYVSNILKSKVKIAPKREVRKLEDLHEEISFDDAVDLGWVPMTKDEEDYSLRCPKCGSKNIAYNRDINDPWIKCLDCGYYLRESDSDNSKNSGFIKVDIKKDGTIICAPTNNSDKSTGIREIKKL